jgi:CheY-like chemotaxis protein
MLPGKVLLVDDDDEDKFIIKDAMVSLDSGDNMWYANNGDHALEMLEVKLLDNLKPCLIVLDLNMPKMNGTETLIRLKEDERFKDIPVVIYSTSINRLEKEKCMKLGAHSYITKPISFSESMNTARFFLDFCQPVK